MIWKSKKAKEVKPKKPNKRQFQRVELDVQEGHAKSLLNAEVQWGTEEVSRIFDLSYTGAAVSRPRSQELTVCHTYPLKIRLGRLEECLVKGEVMWFNDKLVGMAFQPLTKDTRVIFNSFLDDKLIGANLSHVNSKLYHEDNDFDVWFQGPNDTNVYLWTKKNDGHTIIDSARVELDDFVLRYRHGRIVEIGGGATEGGGSAKYSEVTDDVEFKEMDESERAFVDRVIGMLSQIKDQKSLLGQLIDDLAKADY